MRRAATGAWFVAAGGLLGACDLLACGDKPLTISRPVRSQRAHGAVRRASILVLLDARGHLEAALHQTDLERDLKLAGHRLREVRTRTDLSQQVRAGVHDILLVDVGEAAALGPELLQTPGSPSLLPVLVNATGEEWEEAVTGLQCIRGSPSLGKHYLTVIEEVMAQRNVKRAKEAK
jgi:hypothetical protein